MPFIITLTFVVAGVVATIALIIALSWLIARLWCAPRRRSSSARPQDHALPWEAISFKSKDVMIAGWLIPWHFMFAPAPTIIIVHGWSGSRGDMLPAARALYQTGFSVVLFETRGHGASGTDGPITVLKFAEDIRACLDYLDTRQDVDQRRIGLLGHSLGGSSALLAASMDRRVRAVVSCSAFADPRTITADLLRRFYVPIWPFLALVCTFIERWLGTTMEDVAPENRIGQIEVPLLLLHGEHDRFIPPAHAARLYAMADPDRAQMRLLAGRRHFDVIKDARCGAEIVQFFRAHLIGGACADQSSDHTVPALASHGVSFHARCPSKQMDEEQPSATP